MPPIAVSVINASTVVTDDECRTAGRRAAAAGIAGFRSGLGHRRDVGLRAEGGTPAAGTWWLSILDNTDRAGVLGHHDLTPDGLPVGKSFAGTDKHYGHSWTVTASHELLEMLADPDINLTVFVHPAPGDGPAVRLRGVRRLPGRRVRLRHRRRDGVRLRLPSLFPEFPRSPAARGSTIWASCRSRCRRCWMAAISARST